MKLLCAVAVAMCLVGFWSELAISNGQNDGSSGYQIAIAPSTIALGSPVDAVTVHSNIPAAMVVDGGAALNGVTLVTVWADDRGHLAARLALDALPGIAPPSATFTLTAEFVDGTAVTASDTVKVVTTNRK